MGCTQVASTEEQLLNNFFCNLPIRTKSPLEVGNFILSVIDVHPDDYSEQNFLIIKKYLINNEYKLESQEMFQCLLNDCLQNNDNEESIFKYPFLLLVYVFLCKNNSEEAYDVSLKIIKKFKFNNNGDMVKKETLTKLVKLYITVITSYSIKFLESTSLNKQRLTDLKEFGFKENVVDLYIENYLLSHVTSNAISLYKFFHKNYSELTWDNIIRAKIITLSYQHTENFSRRKSNIKNKLLDEQTQTVIEIDNDGKL